MKRVVLILIVLSLTLILGSAVAGYAKTGRFNFTLPDTWLYEEAGFRNAKCGRFVNGQEVASFALFDEKNNKPWPESPEEIAAVLIDEFNLKQHNTDAITWEEIEIAGQKTAKVTFFNTERGTAYLTAVNFGPWHAAALCSILKGYEIDQEFENILASITQRDEDDIGYFRFGDAEVQYKGARKKKVGKTQYLLLDFNWRNAGKDVTIFPVHVEVTVFQDGVQLQEGFLFNEKTEIGTHLMPGKSIDITQIYELRGTGGQIDFTVDKLMDFNHQYVDRKYSFTLKE